MLGLGSSLALGGAPSEFLISSISGLEVWLKFNTGQTTPDIDSDGDSDILWADQSGNGRDGTGGDTGVGEVTIADTRQGTFSGGAWQSALDPDFLKIGDGTLSLVDDYTLFIIFTNHNDADTFIGGATTANMMRLGQGSASAGRWRHDGNQDNLSFDINPSTGKQMWRIERNASDECIITQNSTTGILDAVSMRSEPFSCARIPAGAAGIADGLVYELAVFNRTLTASEISKIEADILDRNSLTAD